MGDLVEWLRAQLDEERAVLLRYRDGHDGPCLNYKGQDPADYSDHDSCALHLEAAEGTPYRDVDFGLREIDAKRQLLADYAVTARIRDEAAARIKAAGDSPDPKDLKTWDRAQREASVLEGPVKLAALPYADRPGYREEWRS